MVNMQKITPFLWFDDKAEEAVNLYISVFKNSRIVNTTHYLDDVPGPKGKVMSITFELEGQEFMALNGGGGVFTFSGAISFFVKCQTQDEIDQLWKNLSSDPKAEQCGWCKDKYGVYWQIIPTILGEMLNDPNTEKVKKVTQAMLQMKKIDIEGLKQAYDQA